VCVFVCVHACVSKRTTDKHGKKEWAKGEEREGGKINDIRRDSAGHDINTSC